PAPTGSPARAPTSAAGAGGRPAPRRRRPPPPAGSASTPAPCPSSRARSRSRWRATAPRRSRPARRRSGRSRSPRRRRRGREPRGTPASPRSSAVRCAWWRHRRLRPRGRQARSPGAGRVKCARRVARAARRLIHDSPVADLDQARARAWEVIAACGHGGALAAAAGSALYPHVWTRDVGVAALGITAGGAAPGALDLLVRSLELIARHQDARGRMPLKVDAAADRPVAENAAGVDAGLWFAVATFAAARALGPGAVARLVEPAWRAVEWTAHLDVDGTELIASPEA